MHENLDVESPMIDLTDCQPKIKEKTLTEAEKRKLRKVAMAKIEDAAMRNIEKIRKTNLAPKKGAKLVQIWAAIYSALPAKTLDNI